VFVHSSIIMARTLSSLSPCWGNRMGLGDGL